MLVTSNRDEGRERMTLVRHFPTKESLLFADPFAPLTRGVLIPGI